MQRSRAEYLINRLINNQLSREELDELLAEMGNGDALADYSNILERYFENLIDHAELDDPQETPIDHEFDFSQTSDKVKPLFIKRLYTTYGRMAAVLALVVGIGATVYLSTWRQLRSATIDSPIAHQTGIRLRETVVSKGKRQSLRLTDGTYVRLNADSKMSYPVAFDGKGRHVCLEGEAYFDVAKDKKRPFSITVEDLKVVVLGTSFNVKAYNDEDEISVTVRSGRVKVALTDNTGSSVILTQNEKITFNRKTEKFQLTTIDPTVDCSWTDGFLQFNRTPLRTVEHTLERWYDVDIIIKDKALYETSFTGKHLNDSLTSALESICFAIDARYEIKGRTVTIFKQ